MLDVVCWALGAFAVVAAIFTGLMLIAAGVRGDASNGRRRCPKCWYDMAGVAANACPECGNSAPQARALYRTRRRPWRVVAGSSLLVGLLVVSVRHEIVNGWVSKMPTSAIIAGLPWLPERACFGWNNGALDERIVNDSLTERQTDLLLWRCRGMLSKGDRAVRMRALWLMYDVGYYGDKPRNWTREVPLLLKCLSSEDAQERKVAAGALGGVGLASDGVVAALIGLLDDGDPKVVEYSLRALRQLGPEAAYAAPKVLSMLEAGRCPYWATAALGAFGDEAKIAVPTLTGMLSTAKGTQQWIVVEALGEIGPAAAEAIPALEAVGGQPASDENMSDQEIREAVQKAIARIRGNGD